MEQQDVVTLTEFAQHPLRQRLWAGVENQRALTVQRASDVEVVRQPKPVLGA